MPELIQATDFDLMSSEANEKLRDKLMAYRDKETIRSTPEYELFRVGKEKGHIALLDKRWDKIDYWVRFETMKQTLIGISTITQVMLWRDKYSSYSSGITREIFFDYLLNEWSAVMSDMHQTERGKEFWVHRIAEAYGKGYRVGLADLSAGTTDWAPDDCRIADWIIARNSAWGVPKQPHRAGFHLSQRFVIANRE